MAQLRAQRKNASQTLLVKPRLQRKLQQMDLYFHFRHCQVEIRFCFIFCYFSPLPEKQCFQCFGIFSCTGKFHVKIKACSSSQAPAQASQDGSLQISHALSTEVPFLKLCFQSYARKEKKTIASQSLLVRPCLQWTLQQMDLDFRQCQIVIQTCFIFLNFRSYLSSSIFSVSVIFIRTGKFPVEIKACSNSQAHAQTSQDESLQISHAFSTDAVLL